jgi:hypothetical protein
MLEGCLAAQKRNSDPRPHLPAVPISAVLLVLCVATAVLFLSSGSSSGGGDSGAEAERKYMGFVKAHAS